ncbi:MAG: serine hydrolase [Pigmentiphaga sp.]|nr:serine hydrolase [Pigmentiphaga sp.]
MNTPAFPPRGRWPLPSATPAGLEAAARFAQEHECDWPRSLFLEDGRYIGTAYVNDQPPYDQPRGLVRARGGSSGLIIRGGEVLAHWGDLERPDTSFSMAKSYLGLLSVVALGQGLIGSVDDPVAATADRFPADDGFASAHNRAITWRHLLQQTSEWQGTLWGIPDRVDHHRQAGPSHDNSAKGTERALQAPGTRWEYNDVRVNRLALSLLQVFRRPLPDVMRETILDPIGASPRWEWHGYDDADFPIDGQPLRSVTGGGHWGGGIFASTADHARVGLLVQAGGTWAGQPVLDPARLRDMLTPCPVQPLYGYLWWLNTDRGLYPSAPASSVFALGGGQHMIWVDPALELTVVVRWLAREHCDAFIARVLDALPA